MELTSLSEAFGTEYELARGHIGVRHTEPDVMGTFFHLCLRHIPRLFSEYSHAHMVSQSVCAESPETLGL